MKADVIRNSFLEFFRANNHQIVPSDSLVPRNDPTVLFTPAGMNQFKEDFLSPQPRFKRAASCQRCLRMDDLDKVGKTSYHHTFFEMLGNFSFGNYFKKEAIKFAWEFLTEVLKINPQKLWVSVYIDDDEAYKIWNGNIKIPVHKIIRLDDSSNFWPAEVKTKGPNGPCGPCSEIFFDRGDNFGCGKSSCSVGCGCGRFVEVWNLVFTQFNRQEDGTLNPLPKKNIDTGMGLERLSALLQGVESNFKTDLFSPIIDEIVAHIDNRDGGAIWDNLCAIADHIRAITFAIYDGVYPSNEERGYIVRKLIRKSVMHLKKVKINKPFLYSLVPIVAEIMKDPYPELDAKKENISQIILTEEKNYLSILSSAQSILNNTFADFLKNKSDEIEAARCAFKLYDTYGIPLEITQEFAKQNNFTLNLQEFNRLLSEQRKLSQEKTLTEKVIFKDQGFFKKITTTKFLGYQKTETEAKVLKIFESEDKTEVILDRTVFYPESGGQVADTGIIQKGNCVFKVKDTQKKDKFIVHIGEFQGNRFKEKDTVLAKIDQERRKAIARNHTATHLLQFALRKILGEHVKQQGSYVGENYLRFDFSHFKPLSFSDIMRIEQQVNKCILNNDKVIKKEMTFEQAKRINALAFFEEKYDRYVRVVSIGDYSKELCAGTHLDFTAEIGIFKIVSFSSVAQGIKRIEAITGSSAYENITEQTHLIQDISMLLKTNPDNLLSQCEKKLTYIKELEKKIESIQFEYIKVLLEESLLKAEEWQGIKIIYKIIPDTQPAVLRKAVDLIKQNTQKAVIFLVSPQKDTVFIVVGVTPSLVKMGLNADKLIKQISKHIGGNGAGREDFAQGSGKDLKELDLLYLKFKEILKTYENNLSS